MQFDYEISAEEYVAAQLLYYKCSVGRKRIDQGIMWVIAGVFMLIAAVKSGEVDWASILVGVTGAWWVYCGLSSVFPSVYLRRQYRKSLLQGKKFHADIDEGGFQVSGDHCSWKVQWEGVTSKSENSAVFMLWPQSANTIFIFGKRHLTDEHQQRLRALAGLPGR